MNAPKPHGGFANRETENVVLWLENDAKHYRHVNKLCRVWFTEPMNYGGERGECLRAFSRAVAAYSARLWPSGATADGCRLAPVDWLEIAAHWVEP